MENLALEKNNFKIDSKGWKQISKQRVILLQHPEKDILEYLKGVPKELIGEQIFTWEAAMRETLKLGRKIPTDKEWGNFKKNDLSDIIYAGFRHCTNGSFYNFLSYAYFWTSSTSGVWVWVRYLFSDNSTIVRDVSDQFHYFSVRCLK